MIFVGVDVQTVRGVTWAALDESYDPCGGELLAVAGNHGTVAESLLGAFTRLGPAKQVAVGIDAPRKALTALRPHQPTRRARRQQGSGVRGRHCEVVIRALNLANPQWTPLEADAPAWMRLGFKLFQAADAAGYVTYEVFPSASYRMLRGDAGSTPAIIKVDLGAVSAAPKDMLDAYVAAYTVGEFVAGRGSEVGGADGLGTIILPRKLQDDVTQPDHHLP